MQATTWSERWKNAFVYGLVATVMVLGSASVLAAYFGDATDRLVQVAVDEATHTRLLVCGILINAESRDIREAVRLYCPELTLPEREVTP
jgi:hypothetical protein